MKIFGLALCCLMALACADESNTPGDAEASGEVLEDAWDPHAEVGPEPDAPPVPGQCWPDSVHHTPCPNGPCNCVEFTADMSEGGIGEVDWLLAEGCVPPEERGLFDGAHVLFATELSPWCGVNACVTPDDPQISLGIYAVRMDPESCELPPPPDTYFACDAAWDQDSSSLYARDLWSQTCPNFNTIKAVNTRCVIVTSGSFEENYLVGVTASPGLQTAAFTLHFGWRYDCGT